MEEMDFWQIYDYRAVFIFWIIAIEIDEKFGYFFSVQLGSVPFRSVDCCLPLPGVTIRRTHGFWIGLRFDWDLASTWISALAAGKGSVWLSFQFVLQPVLTYKPLEWFLLRMSSRVAWGRMLLRKCGRLLLWFISYDQPSLGVAQVLNMWANKLSN